MSDSSRPKAVYEPGELDKVRGRLGPLSAEEAKKMSQVLGGEVGVEKSAAKQAAGSSDRGVIKRNRPKGVEASALVDRQRHREAENGAASGGYGSDSRKAASKPKRHDDDPNTPYKLHYIERVKMDKLMWASNINLKTTGQFLQSVFSFFQPPPDFLNPEFISREISVYVQPLNTLVTATRSLFNKTNTDLDARMKKSSAFAYETLNTIREWDTQTLNSELSNLQMHPRNVTSIDMTNFLKAFFKPLYLLDRLDLDNSIGSAYRLLVKALLVQNPQGPRDQYQKTILECIENLGFLRKEARFHFYPIIMKLISDKCFTCSELFDKRQNRYAAFLGLSKENQIEPSQFIQVKNNAAEKKKEEEEEQQVAESDEEELKRKAIEQENKAVAKGYAILDSLFPGAGWNNVTEAPDMYPYFNDVFRFPKEYVDISPTDPLLQVVILTRVIDELLYALRYVAFGSIDDGMGGSINLEEELSEQIENWHAHLDSSLEKEYIPRLSEYCRLLENPAENHNSDYARRLSSDTRWIKRYFFMPYFSVETAYPPPFRKKEIKSLYSEVRKLRRNLSIVAKGIEAGQKKGGAHSNASCDEITNPWDAYKFQIPNPLSKRLNLLLEGKPKNNAALIYYLLGISVVLDYMVNDDKSWAYAEERGSILFRSLNNEGVVPQNGADKGPDTRRLFEESLKKHAN
ncbi:MAG: hypothetical protein LBM77_13875 [Spirochaetaceae bacterium]|jgi:hypothetical protein|nr:hypothetical protein [Spirochaetaceae bacterium]